MKAQKHKFLNRKQIKSLIQFIDARHDIQKNDIQMREWVRVTAQIKCEYYKEYEEVKVLEKTLSKLKDGYIFCR